MVIGIVVNVMEEEHAIEAREQALADGEPTIQDLSNQIKELKEMLQNR
jgi:voltage-gated sodium channel